jgi:beta-ribofuranosylaminobenzene 5'-phosphate synthase
MASGVTVTTTARLHFGFLDPSGRSTEPFGSFGLSLDQPRTRLTLARADSASVRGPQTDRASLYLATLAETYDLDGSYALDVAEAIPSHAGLGSGTQLALAVGAAFAALEGLDLSPPDIAARLGRGARSGIGIATFEAGGAVLDAGPRDDALPRLVARVPFPEEWRVLLILDLGTKGLAGTNEVEAFAALPAFPETERRALESCITAGALPALENRDFATFCEKVSHLQHVMGAYFGPLQGGLFTSARVAAVANALRENGEIGLGQSSWGSTGFAFAPSEDAGERLLAAAREADGSGALTFTLARGRNAGAEIVAYKPKNC